MLEVGAEDDAEQLAELTLRLRNEMLELDVADVKLATGGRMPEGAKGADLASAGALVLDLTLWANVLRSVVDTTVAWLGRQGARSAKLTLDGDTLEVAGLSSDEQSRLIEQWVTRHARDG